MSNLPWMGTVLGIKIQQQTDKSIGNQHSGVLKEQGRGQTNQCEKPRGYTEMVW